MSVADFDERGDHGVEDECRVNMELIAARLRDLILSQPPRALIGFIWAEFSLRPMLEDDAGKDAQAAQFVLAYVHAVLASFGDEASDLDEAVCAEIVETAHHLRDATQRYCDVLTAEGAGAPARWTEAHALSDWISIRGQGHRAPEQEFFEAVLAPHDEALRRSYGVGAAEIAAGLQAAADAMRKACARAVARIAEHAQVVNALAADRGVAPERASELWAQEQPERAQASEEAFAELFGGGICNLSRHTQLPAALLQDLSFARAENTEFFGAGPLAGTPLRALPVRVKPLIALDGEYFAVHPDFLGQAAYRQILRGLLERNPNPAYRREFRARQSAFGGQAFERVLAEQLAGATVLHEICYRDATTREWVENDTLIRLEDVLILVEAKAGVAATIAPPAADFVRQARAAQDVVGKTYQQCRRFFDYLASADEVPLFRRDAGRYVECVRVRLSDFRVMLPIGLIVEPLGPFSALCNALPEIELILGRLRFMPMSVDDLIVLRRSLPAAGDLLASLWRQSSPNPDATMPRIERPAEVTSLLDALQAAREPGWLHADNLIRAFGSTECEELASGLLEMTETLVVQEHGWFQFAGDPPLFCWLQRYGTLANVDSIAATARAAAIATGAREVVVVIAHKTTATDYSRAVVLKVDVPPPGSAEHEHARGAAERLQTQQNAVTAAMNHEEAWSPAAAPPARTPGRNEPCWCGSGKKFKRCHGSL